MKLFLKLIITIIAITGTTYGQGIAIGEWRDHLPYKNTIDVADAGNLVYCASQYCLFTYNKYDNSVERLNKVNGLSDIGISCIKYSVKYKILLVVYNNTNIDIIDKNGNITNFSDIKRKQILGGKTINNITIIDDNAYFSCSFGIIVFNLAKEEISDTYFIGLQGSAMNINDFTSDGAKFYATTDNGIYTASVNAVNLADYNSWAKITSLPKPDKKYSTIAFFNNKIYVNQANKDYSTDTIYIFDGNSWKAWDKYSKVYVNRLSVNQNKLLISAYGFIDVIDKNDSIVQHVYQYNVPGWPIAMGTDLDINHTLWVADQNSGLIRIDEWNFCQFITPDGPASNKVFAMSILGKNLWVATGGKDDTWNNIYLQEGVYNYDFQNWHIFNKKTLPNFDTLFDCLSVAIDPNDYNTAYIGTWSKGLIKFNNLKVDKIYNETNSSLRSNGETGDNYRLRVGGICFDSDHNMWVTNPGADKPLSVLYTNNGKSSWYSYKIYGITNDMTLSNIIIDNYNQKWIILPRGNGVLVYNDNNTVTNPLDDNYKILLNLPGREGEKTSNVISIANDLEGEIWIGTDQGVVVIYSPSNAFPDFNLDPQQILLEQDGHWQHLLETEVVTAIAVDGANRKWFGTQNSGVYLMSADGTKQIEHFTEDNSPLLSNTITSISINKETGEVFFGTLNGIISYKGTATEGKETFEDKSGVYAYPNPVKHDYNGPIAIKGLVRDANVKITGINGNLVYSIRANGGQAIWDGRNFEGERVHSGVYLVFCTNDDGSQNMVTKIMVLN